MLTVLKYYYPLSLISWWCELGGPISVGAVTPASQVSTGIAAAAKVLVALGVSAMIRKEDAVLN